MGKLLSFSMNYLFTCKFCSTSGLEVYRRTQASSPQMCVTTIANLQRKTMKDGAPRYFFSRDKEIIPFIEAYWESITTSSRKTTNGWFTTIHKTLQSNPNIFVSQDNGGDLLYSLVEKDLEMIKPKYEKVQQDGE